MGNTCSPPQAAAGICADGQLPQDARPCAPRCLLGNRSTGHLDDSHEWVPPRGLGVPEPSAAEDLARLSTDLPFQAPSDLVCLHLYDLSETLGHLNAVGVDLLGLGGALHAGVEVYGEEFSFGAQGVCVCPPRRHTLYSYRQTIHMGRTHRSREEVAQDIDELAVEWPGKTYDLLDRNCCTFAEALCLRLGVGSLPSWVNRLAATGGSVSAVRGLVTLLGGAPPLQPPPGARAAAATHRASGEFGFEAAPDPLQKEASGHLEASPMSLSLRRLPKQRCEAFCLDSKAHTVSALVPGVEVGTDGGYGYGGG